ncbi:uncharacterized protein Dmul_02700 [Desulfococcus multivorans]|nr:uncharacterized protein Dmul_02700 [Desulfococcus multivorans]
MTAVQHRPRHRNTRLGFHLLPVASDTLRYAPDIPKKKGASVMREKSFLKSVMMFSFLSDMLPWHTIFPPNSRPVFGMPTKRN